MSGRNIQVLVAFKENVDSYAISVLTKNDEIGKIFNIIELTHCEIWQLLQACNLVSADPLAPHNSQKVPLIE